MSGHSKWSTIKHQKSVADQRRGKLFSKLSRAIALAAREGGGGEPENNPRLRLAIDQAKEANMPKDNIKRAIERGLGKGGEGRLERAVYEGFGPEKTAVVVESVTDNKNRTVSVLKSLFDQAGGSLGAPGSASYLFQKKGLILVKKEKNAEEQILKLIDLGVEDVEEDDLFIEVYTAPQQLGEIKNKVKELGFVIKEASLALKPTTVVSVEDPKKKEKILNFLEKIENLDDVQKVFCNVDFVSND